jgi:hypothetical protein
MGDGSIRPIGASQGTAVSTTAAASPARPLGGNPALAQTAAQLPAAPAVLSLKEIARADTTVVQRTIGEITNDLAGYVTQETGGTGNSSAIAQRLVKEGRELQQRTTDFATQSQAKVWALRVLSWIGSVVTFGALPGLAKLIAPKSDFADSLSRYLLGNDITNGEKLEKFDQLLGKFQELHGLATRNAELKQQLEEAQKIPRPLLEVWEQLVNCRSKLSQVAGFARPQNLKETEKGHYQNGQAISREVCKPIETRSDGKPVPLDVMLNGLVSKLCGLPENVDTAAIRAQAQALSDEFKELEATMRSGEGRAFDKSGELEQPSVVFKREPLGFEDSVRQQAQNVQQKIQSLKQAFDTLEATDEVRDARARVAAIKNEQAANKAEIASASPGIRSSILELGPRKAVPENRASQAITDGLNKIFQDYFVNHTGEAASSTSHYRQDYRDIAEKLLNGGGIKCIPENCWFRKDALRGFYFVLQIGDTTIDGRDIMAQNGVKLTDELRAQTIQKIVDAVRIFAEKNNLDPAVVLGNLLRTYQGQAATAAVPTGIASTLDNDKFQHDLDMHKDPNSFERITIDPSGSCRVSHNASLPFILLNEREAGAVIHRTPCSIQVEIAYTSSLEDFTNGQPPRTIPEQCGCSGHYLDLSAMA